MRLQSLLALTAASALLLPMAAQADWPAGKKGAYMQQCAQVATGQGLDAKAADAHCKCGAAAIEKNFSKDEIEDLDSKDGVDAKLMQRAQTVVTQACAPKKN
ncbi:hypothetical protein PS627_00021 [Pseudomonas fluorescens]|uniref:hypothetical protein n=1 Tax=Pseudomonas fluorescens TaxID=294 RepID=UPI0012560403|nr:hypothetical protein [Pseudomonas fluorescens]CAG8863086.1 hypothetical protein PS627_00021 [Pseudomonas fluorescens]VVP68890.1 hypothetical protein PS910_00457 [Pseudomonas fluorescens]